RRLSIMVPASSPTRPLPLFSLVYLLLISLFFFFNDTPTTEIYTLSLHDALPICHRQHTEWGRRGPGFLADQVAHLLAHGFAKVRSEEHTSELQSLTNIVCRLLLEKKKNSTTSRYHHIKTYCDIRQQDM